MKIREYDEGHEVEIQQENGRWVIIAWNEGHCSRTCVDLEDVMEWVTENKSELIATLTAIK